MKTYNSTTLKVKNVQSIFTLFFCLLLFLVLSINSDGNVKSINKNQNLKSADCEALPPDSIMIDTATIDTISVIEIYEFGDSAITFLSFRICY